jgi:hypothetical protein
VQHHQHPSNVQHGGAGGGFLPPTAGQALQHPRGSLADTGAPGDPCVQPGNLYGKLPSTLPQPTSIDKYTGETDPRVWLNNYRLAC